MKVTASAAVRGGSLSTRRHSSPATDVLGPKGSARSVGATYAEWEETIKETAQAVELQPTAMLLEDAFREFLSGILLLNCRWLYIAVLFRRKKAEKDNLR